MDDREIVKHLKVIYGKDLVSAIRFGSSLFKEKPGDVDLIVIVKKPKKSPKIKNLSILQLTPKQFVENLAEKSPTLVGMYLMGYKVLYGKHFFYKYLPALANRISRKDVIYKGGRIYKML